ncbi:fungal-specific transcription factor domain-containing protein [Leptodontidium sp. MPI-SDFR-AT-0119]|nr:fungal-specific transcription factor domain-containing protein [Leptodontidium sp. MPI-SDFR-AT-0119]
MSNGMNQSANTKCVVACEYCRAKKIKCDAVQPCKSCVSHGRASLCYLPSPNPRPRRNAKERHKLLQDKLDRAEALLRAAGLTTAGLDEPEAQVVNSTFDNFNQPDGVRGHANTSTHTSQPPPLSGGPVDNAADPSFLPSPLGSYTSQGHSRQSGMAELGHDGHSPRTSVVVSNSNPNSIRPHRSASLGGAPTYNSEAASAEHIGRFPDTHSAANAGGNTQLQSPMTSPDSGESPTQIEVHGPGSFLSVCSDAGMVWVATRIGGPSNFTSSAASLASFVARSLKLQQPSKVERVAEPDPETARKYAQIFFEECFEGTMNVIHRSNFEARLNAHLDSGDNDTETDPAWYALRNTVYAFGARTTTNRDSQTNGWAEAQLHGWKYFQNAFSVHSDLVYSWSSVPAVQAVFCMAIYVEGIGAPKLEYMLISNALRLAQAKGLYTKPSASWNIPEAELQNRRWLFWSIYVYEKHICFRSRRPSMVDDDDIDCPFPDYAPDGNSHGAEILKHVIYHAQITSAVMKDLLSVKGRRKPPSIIAKIVQELDARLESWQNNLPHYLKPTLPLQTHNLPAGLFAEHKLWVYLSYYGTLSAIHSVFACPWNSPSENVEPDNGVQEQMNRSLFVVADAARKIILVTRSITIDATAPVWLTFFFPLMSMVNLFTYILGFPSLPSVSADLGLLDMVAGYFGYLGFSTSSQISLSFAKEITQWARAAVGRASEGQVQQGRAPFQGSTVSKGLTTDFEISYDFGDIGRADFSLDDWPTFFPAI